MNWGVRRAAQFAPWLSQVTDVQGVPTKCQDLVSEGEGTYSQFGTNFQSAGHTSSLCVGSGYPAGLPGQITKSIASPSHLPDCPVWKARPVLAQQLCSILVQLNPKFFNRALPTEGYLSRKGVLLRYRQELSSLSDRRVSKYTSHQPMKEMIAPAFLG